MSRIATKFAALGERKALVTFVTAGDPTLVHTVPAMHAMVAGGADILELGIPFSDPEAEGPSIQASSERALANNVSLKTVLDMVRSFREKDSDTPVVLMGYLNSILAMTDFAEQASSAGADGLIMVNLPPEEAHTLKPDLAKNGIDLIFLIAPTTTDARATTILSQASGFAYYVSLKGITGADHLDTDQVATRLAKLRAESEVPVCVGFGIKDPETAKAVGAHADGVVVGSALVNIMAEGEEPEACAERLRESVQALRNGLDEV